MPTYPVAAPSLTNDILTINRFLEQPTLVQHRIRDIASKQFIGEKLLSGKVQANGGAIVYGVSESIYADRDPRAVNAGAEYPRALVPDGQAAILQMTKYGQDVPLTDEKIAREQYRSVDVALGKSANRTVAYTDSTILGVVNAAVTQTQAATASWGNAATADMLRDVMLAEAQIRDLGEDYVPDVLVTTYQNAAYITSNQKVVSGMPRESNQLIVNGEFGKIGGLMIWAVPAARMPQGVGAFVADSNMLGFVGWEDIQSPEYTGPASGIQTFVRRNPVANDEWLIRTRRIFAPAVTDPLAAVKITGV